MSAAVVQRLEAGRRSRAVSRPTRRVASPPPWGRPLPPPRRRRSRPARPAIPTARPACEGDRRTLRAATAPDPGAPAPGQRQEPRATPVRHAADAARRLVAVHRGQAEVHQHHVRREGRRGGDGLRPVLRRGDGVAPRPQQHAPRLADCRMVLDHEDVQPQAAAAAGAGRRLTGGRVGCAPRCGGGPATSSPNSSRSRARVVLLTARRGPEGTLPRRGQGVRFGSAGGRRRGVGQTVGRSWVGPRVFGRSRTEARTPIQQISGRRAGDGVPLVLRTRCGRIPFVRPTPLRYPHPRPGSRPAGDWATPGGSAPAFHRPRRFPPGSPTLAPEAPPLPERRVGAGRGPRRAGGHGGSAGERTGLIRRREAGRPMVRPTRRSEVRFIRVRTRGGGVRMSDLRRRRARARRAGSHGWAA